MIFDVRAVREGSWELVVVVGEVDLATAPAFRAAAVDAAARAVSAGRGLAIDLASCDLIDSVGLGILLGASRRARSGGIPFGVVVPDPRIRSVFERCRLDEVLDLVGHRVELGSLGSADGEGAAGRG